MQRLWATIADTVKRGITCSRRGGGQRHSLFARRQVELPLRWIVEYWGQSPPPLRRTLRVSTPHAALEIVTDASHFGIAGYLEATHHGVILQYFTSELTADDEHRFNARIGEANGQQYWEALAILASLRIWGQIIAEHSATVRVRGDSVVALTLARKLASSSPLLNGIGAEIALELETHDICEVITTHTPGKLLVLADYLSRDGLRLKSTSHPGPLRSAKRRKVPVRDDNYYKVWKVAVS